MLDKGKNNFPGTVILEKNCNKNVKTGEYLPTVLKTDYKLRFETFNKIEKHHLSQDYQNGHLDIRFLKTRARQTNCVSFNHATRSTSFTEEKNEVNRRSAAGEKQSGIVRALKISKTLISFYPHSSNTYETKKRTERPRILSTQNERGINQVTTS